MPTVDIRPFHERPVELRRAIKDEFAPGGRALDVLRLPLRQHRCTRYTLTYRKKSLVGQGRHVDLGI